MKNLKILKISVAIIIVVLICLRLYLPYFLLSYVEKQINKIPEYHVNIADLDVQLYRGSYTLKKIQLWKINKKIPVPYFAADIIEFSVEWKSLLHGKLVAKIITEKPVINFVTGSKNNEQLTISSQWIDIIKTLFPLNINHFEAHEGQVYFRSFNGNPPFKTYIKNIEFTIDNMQNAQASKQLLSSSFYFKGNPIGGGNVLVQGKFNPFNTLPTFNLDAKLTSLNIKFVASLLKHYTNLDVIGGTFSLYGEAAAAKGKIKGYAKPFIKNLKIGQPKDGSPLSAIVDGLANVAAKILENPKQKTIATKINISGNIDDPDTSIFAIIGYLLQHAFINGLLPEIDNTIEMQDVYYGKHQPVRRPSSGKRFSTYRY